MSGSTDKVKHSKRLLKDQNAITKQTKILKAHHFPIQEPLHKYAKKTCIKLWQSEMFNVW